MPTYTYDHIHLRTRDPEATARYYNEMFDAKIIESVQSDGQKRIDLDINGLTPVGVLVEGARYGRTVSLCRIDVVGAVRLL